MDAPRSGVQNLPPQPPHALVRQTAQVSMASMATAMPPAPVAPASIARSERREARTIRRGVVHGSHATFDREVLESDVPVLVDFYATWCGPCKALAPTLEEIAAESPQAKVVKINVDENPKLAARYGIKALPSLVVFKDGRITAKEKGLVSKTRLKAMLDL